MTPSIVLLYGPKRGVIPPYDPRYRPTVRSYEELVSYNRGTPVAGDTVEARVAGWSGNTTPCRMTEVTLQNQVMSLHGRKACTLYPPS